MAHRFSPTARIDLGEIWEYIARRSGSDLLADNQIDAIADRFYLLSEHPKVGRARDEDSVLEHAASPLVITSSSMTSLARMSGFRAW